MKGHLPIVGYVLVETGFSKSAVALHTHTLLLKGKKCMDLGAELEGQKLEVC